ncbi:MAG: 3-ketoacyl-ACP reductase [Phycisphaerae bacterium]|jgi:NAD(P)-dependent dehydrogenase (short-subunit alcohol dehydrogenase family)|nr:3-ketoacyl-ACP reductase [Phycisphaerae bacterium]
MNKSPLAMITGAARGIGAAIAVELAKNGMDIAIFDVIDSAQVADEVRAAGQTAISIVGDVTNAQDRQRAIDAVKQEFGRLDVLVNNAGVAPSVRADILEASEESYDRVMGINLKGPYFLTQAAAGWMIEQRKERPDDWMCVVNISSCSAYAASPSRGEYCLSKAAVSMATKLYAARLAEHNIGVYEIRPGIIATDMTAAVKDKYDKLIAEGLTPIKRWGLPGDVAAAAATCARGELKFSTGEVINVDGGFHLRTL